MNKITSFSHFASLSKRPTKNFKCPTSIPSPKNSSRKFPNNYQSPNKEEELILIKRKFLNKSKDLKQTSSYLSFVSPSSYIYLNKQNKLNNSIKSQLILTSMDNSSIAYSKDKIYFYLNNSNYNSNKNNNNNLNKSLNNKSYSINVKKKNENNSQTHSNSNLYSNSSNQKKKFAFISISSRKNSNEKKKSENKILFPQNQKLNSFSNNKSFYNRQNKSNNKDNSYSNNKKNIFNSSSNNNQYNHKFNINFITNYLKITKKQNNNNTNNKSASINNINASYGQVKSKKIISSTAKASPRISLYNLNSISSRINKIQKNNNVSLKDYEKGVKKNKNIANNCINNVNKSMNLYENIINNNNLIYNKKQKKNSNSKEKIIKKSNNKKI